MDKKIVIDTNSLINFFRYYYFDKDNGAKIYNDLIKFFLSKVKSGEIVVIDKVFNEVRDSTSKKIIQPLENYVINTEFLFEKVSELITAYSIPLNIKRYSVEELGKILDDLEKKDADLYLVAYCKYLKESGADIILISDESFKADKKVVEKVPTICKGEAIECNNLPYTLFEIYKNELKFNLEVNI